MFLFERKKEGQLPVPGVRAVQKVLPLANLPVMPAVNSVPSHLLFCCVLPFPGYLLHCIMG